MNYTVFLFNKTGSVVTYNKKILLSIPYDVAAQDIMPSSTSTLEIGSVEWPKLIRKYFGAITKSTYAFIAFPEPNAHLKLWWPVPSSGVLNHYSALTTRCPIISFNFNLIANEYSSPANQPSLRLRIGSSGAAISWINGIQETLGGFSTDLVKTSDFIGGTMEEYIIPTITLNNTDASNYPPNVNAQFVSMYSDLTLPAEGLAMYYKVNTGNTSWTVGGDGQNAAVLKLVSMDTLLNVVPSGSMSTVGGEPIDEITPFAFNADDNDRGSSSNYGNLQYVKR